MICRTMGINSEGLNLDPRFPNEKDEQRCLLAWLHFEAEVNN
jgi:hypothetical protein